MARPSCLHPGNRGSRRGLSAALGRAIGIVDRSRLLASNPEDAETPQEAPALAVALREEAEGGNPRVTAAGRGALAEQILEIAFARGVKVREDAELAEILSAIEVDSEVPVEALAAVAEILSYVYRANAAPATGAQDPSGDGPR